MKTQHKFLWIGLLFLCYIVVTLFGVFSQSNKGSLSEGKRVAEDQIKNFNDDLNNARTYWVHNDLGWGYAKRGQYDKAAEEYKKAIQIIENIPGEVWENVSKEEMARINRESQVSEQIFPRYRLIEALEKTGRFEEAIQNVEWLIQNQKMRGKEEFLRKKLEGMKNNLLKKLQNEK